MSKIAGIAAVLTGQTFAEMPVVDKMRTFNAVVEEARKDANARDAGGTDEGWAELYNQVFGGAIGNAQKVIFQEAGLTLDDYYDPDTSYQEDATAYLDTVTESTKAYLAGVDQVMKGLGL